MEYDGTGRRLVKQYDPKLGASGIKRTEYVFDLLDPAAEFSMWNGQHTTSIGATEPPVTMHTFPSGQSYWYQLRRPGHHAGLTEDQGQSVHNYRYDVYGTVVPVNGNWTEPHNHYTFTGQEWVDETTLLHFYARDYDPSTGVWMQQDPYRGRLAEPITLHRYGTLANNPINAVDLMGMSRQRTNVSQVAKLWEILGRFGNTLDFLGETATGFDWLYTYQGYRNGFIKWDWIKGLADGSVTPELTILKNRSGTLAGVVKSKLPATLATRGRYICKDARYDCSTYSRHT